MSVPGSEVEELEWYDLGHIHSCKHYTERVAGFDKISDIHPIYNGASVSWILL